MFQNLKEQSRRQFRERCIVEASIMSLDMSVESGEAYTLKLAADHYYTNLDIWMWSTVDGEMVESLSATLIWSMISEA